MKWETHSFPSSIETSKYTRVSVWTGVVFKAALGFCDLSGWFTFCVNLLSHMVRNFTIVYFWKDRGYMLPFRGSSRSLIFKMKYCQLDRNKPRIPQIQLWYQHIIGTLALVFLTVLAKAASFFLKCLNVFLRKEKFVLFWICLRLHKVHNGFGNNDWDRIGNYSLRKTFKTLTNFLIFQMLWGL